MSPPGWKLSKYTTGEEQTAITNNSRKDELTGPKWKWRLAVDASGGESQVWPVVLEETLESPWTVRSSRSILKETNTEYSLEGLLLKFKFQYFGHLRWRASSLEKTLMMGNIEGKRQRGPQRITWLDSITNSVDMNLSKLEEIVEDREAWHATVHGVTRSRRWLSDWTTRRKRKSKCSISK